MKFIRLSVSGASGLFPSFPSLSSFSSRPSLLSFVSILKGTSRRTFPTIMLKSTSTLFVRNSFDFSKTFRTKLKINHVMVNTISPCWNLSVRSAERIAIILMLSSELCQNIKLCISKNVSNTVRIISKPLTNIILFFNFN